MNELARNVLITVILLAVVALIGLGIWKMLVRYAEKQKATEDEISVDEEISSDEGKIDLKSCIAIL